ncbi:MAG: gamma-glutamyltransferase [Oscillospiraceae bacterium]|nr:gamma-glutamyltransferase [Oscillospiraceae bacterium]MCL2279402.1 gamma-glutamyltransferase [Oscillospiraceae bacterium]
MKFDSNHNPYLTQRKPVYGTKGMIATSQPLAAEAGLEVLQKGGNAVDAAIATAAALTVVEPTSNGIGGDAFAIVWIDGKMHGLNSSGYAPKSISIDAVQALGHNEMPPDGFIPITVPGAPAAWANLSSRFGKLTLKQCLAPAVTYATDGYPLSPVLAENWALAYMHFCKTATAPEYKAWFDTFAPKKTSPPKVGEIWNSPAHAETLLEIAETNAESFYRGRLANTISNHITKLGGFLTKADLEEYTPQWAEPISANYRGYDVWEMPPNGQGLVALIALNIFNEFDIANASFENSCHMAFEAMKLAFTAGKEFITDPNYMTVSVEELLSKEYAQKLRNKITDTALEPAPINPNSGGTVYLCTADKDGNMVSFIQSNYMGFGSGIVIPGTGISMHNRGADFSLDPKHANALAPQKKTYHTIIPGFLTKDGVPIGPFGVMGGYMQPQGHMQVIINTVDYNLNPQAALDCPRWQWIEGKNFEVESAFCEDVRESLIKRGHKVTSSERTGKFGRGQIIWRDTASGVLCGGTESRCDGHIAVW